MASTNAGELDVDMELYKRDPVYRAIMNMIHIPEELEKVDKDDYSDFFNLTNYLYEPEAMAGPAPEPEAMAGPAPEPEAMAGPSGPPPSRKERSKRKLIGRADTTNEQIEKEKSMHQSLLDSLNVGDKNIFTFQFKDITSSILSETNEFILKKGTVVEKLTITPESRITLKQQKKISDVVILELKFIGKTNSSLFNKIHLSFWPRKTTLSGANPLKLSKKDFTLFQKGSIHIVLEKVKGALGPVYAKLRIDDSLKQFYITQEDLDSIGESENGANIQRFVLLLIDIINSTAPTFFPNIGAFPFRKRRSKKKSYKKKPSKKRRSKKRSRKKKTRRKK